MMMTFLGSLIGLLAALLAQLVMYAGIYHLPLRAMWGGL